VCEFCSLFNSVGLEIGIVLESEIISVVDTFEPVLFCGEFYSLFLVRAPPAVFC
jgi:hypothetical protein